LVEAPESIRTSRGNYESITFPFESWTLFQSPDYGVPG